MQWPLGIALVRVVTVVRKLGVARAEDSSVREVSEKRRELREQLRARC